MTPRRARSAFLHLLVSLLSLAASISGLHVKLPVDEADALSAAALASITIVPEEVMRFPLTFDPDLIPLSTDRQEMTSKIIDLIYLTDDIDGEPRPSDEKTRVIFMDIDDCKTSSDRYRRKRKNFGNKGNGTNATNVEPKIGVDRQNGNDGSNASTTNVTEALICISIEGVQPGEVYVFFNASASAIVYFTARPSKSQFCYFSNTVVNPNPTPGPNPIPPLALTLLHPHPEP